MEATGTEHISYNFRAVSIHFVAMKDQPIRKTKQ
jgi:hypothetical protein